MKYEDIISIKNLYEAWEEFLLGKKQRKDVAEFSLNLSKNIFYLHTALVAKNYKHESYSVFSINDPKPRIIHKASVRDRLLHRAVYRILYPYFDETFVPSSFSCRKNKGNHKALEYFEEFSKLASFENKKTCWVLKCDIRKCFASVDQNILLTILESSIKDSESYHLLKEIIQSFCSTEKGKGLPLGNLTSQLFINIYLDRLDKWIEDVLKIKYYMRYADDFVIFDTNRDSLLEFIPKIAEFLDKELKLLLHPNKIFVKTLASGVDFLGWVHFPTHRVLRTATKKKMFRNLKLKEGEQKENAVISYLGMLKWGNGWKLSEQIKN